MQVSEYNLLLLLLLLCVMIIPSILNEIVQLTIYFICVNYSYLSVYIAVEHLESRVINLQKRKNSLCALKREANDLRIEAKQAQQSLERAEKR